MTMFEKIKAMNVEELAKLFCENTTCAVCPANELCTFGHNGMKELLEREVEEDGRD